MNAQSQIPYPGSCATVVDILALAEQYQCAAHTLLAIRQKKRPLSTAPGRHCALHAIELFLNAVARQNGASAANVRAQYHAVDDPKIVTALGLRKKTHMHLSALTRDREYLVIRYAPDMMSDMSEINRLTATLDEVARKAKAACGAQTYSIAPKQDDLNTTVVSNTS